MPKKSSGCDYSAQVKKLHNEGPGRTYLLYGPEDYLRDSFLSELKKTCVPEGENSFNYHRFDGPIVDNKELHNAIDSLPFLGDRVFVEIHDADLSQIELQDVPEYCTVALICSDVDGRFKAVKSVENNLCFSQAEQNSMFRWVRRRFAANDKEIGDEAIRRLIYISGDLMNKLIPEIDKISGYAKGKEVLVSDVNAVANHIPDADTFELVDSLCNQQYEKAISILGELFGNKDSSAVAIVSSISYQYRRLYAAKNISNKKSLMDILGIRYDFIADNLISASRKISKENIKKAIEDCCEAEYRMKISSEEDIEIIKSLILKTWKS